MRGPVGAVGQFHPPAVFYRHQHPDIGLRHWLLRNVGTLLACHGDVPDIGLHEGGYLYLATQAGEATLRENHALQKQHGADVALLSPQQLAERFPWLALNDVVLGSLGLSGEGGLTATCCSRPLRKKARARVCALCGR